MFRLILFLLLLLPYTTYSQKSEAQREADEVAERIRKWMEWSNPTPVLKAEEQDYPLMPTIVLPDNTNAAVFNDVNTIVEEAASGFVVQNESSIAVNPKNPLNLIAAAVDYRDNGARWVYVSSDAGKTWKNLNLGIPATGWTGSNDPSVTFAADGTGYLMYGGFGNREVGSPENGVFVARTKDEGKTWQSHFAVIQHKGTQTADSNFEDKYYVHVDNSPASPYFGRVYTPWKRVISRDSSTQIVNTFSTDEGATWSVPLRVSERLSGTSEDTTFGQSFPLTITGPLGEVYVIWNHGIKKAIGFAKSTDGAKTFSAPRLVQHYKELGIARKIPEGIRHTVKGKVRAESYPSIVCDIYTAQRKGWLYMVWAADRIPNVYFSRSTDGGDTWSTPKIVHSDTTNDQFWSWLALDPTNGDLAVMYLDSRDDPTNLLTSCYVSYSSDGGDTWIDKRASDAESDLRRNPFNGNAFAGDYSGCAFHNGKIYPSWVDMRNAKQTNANNDVYTALVDVYGLLPPPSFIAKTIPDINTALDLEWKKPETRGFNKPLGDFSYQLFRDNVLIKTFPKETVSYRDEGLENFKRYAYSIRIFSGADTSVFVYSTAYSGGSREPGIPNLLSAKGNTDNNVSLTVKLPQYRLDSSTLFVNARAVAIYRDGVFLKESEVAATEAGKVITINDNPQRSGWYMYSVRVRDNATPYNESPSSESILTYTGPITDNYKDDFEEDILCKYFASEPWNKVNKGYNSNYSLTESPIGNYKRGMRDSIMLFPVLNPSGTTHMSFRHAAIIHPNDSGIVELSDDMGHTWRTLTAFNSSMFPAWSDNTFTDDDWKPEVLKITGNDTVLVRFRFRSNLSQELNGWYIDNIEFGLTANAEDNTDISQKTILYPNPTKSVVYIKGAPKSDIEIMSILGEQLPVRIIQEYPELMIDVSTFPNGVYSIRHKGTHTTQYFTVQR